MPVPSPSTAGAPASSRLGLRAGVLWTFGGQVVFSAAQFAVVAVLARLGTQVDVGIYALALALTAPVFLLLGLQLRSVQATDTQGQSSFGQYFSLRVVGMGLALLVTAALAALYPQAGWPIWWLGLAKAFEGLSDVIYGLMQRQERLDLVSRSVLGRGVLGLALMAGLFALSRSVELATFGVALAGVLTLLAYDLPRARSLAPPRADGGWWIRFPAALPRLALPLGVVAGLVSMGSALPRLFVEKALGAGPLGVYSALSYVTVAGSVLIVALGTALTTRLSQVFAAGNRTAFLRLTGRLTASAAAVGLGLVLLAALAGRPLLRLLYGDAYAEQNAVFIWLNLSGALGYVASCAGFAVTAARRFKRQVPLFVAVTLVLALACWQLIPSHGLIGAAWAALIAAGVQLVGSWVIVIQALRDRPVPSQTISGDP